METENHKLVQENKQLKEMVEIANKSRDMYEEVVKELTELQERYKKEIAEIYKLSEKYHKYRFVFCPFLLCFRNFLCNKGR